VLALVIAAGSGGSSGGASAGDVIEVPIMLKGTMGVTVGLGGLGGSCNGPLGDGVGRTFGENGGNSTFGPLLAIGGKGGAPVGSDGLAGVLGSGSGCDSSALRLGGIGSKYDGGGNADHRGSPHPAGGGAGNSGDGASAANDTHSGNGGPGVLSAVLGTRVGGGGAGGVYGDIAHGAVPGVGVDGGGNGGNEFLAGIAGVDGTGGGGGGTGCSTGVESFVAGKGGKGLVVIRYPLVPPDTGRIFFFHTGAWYQAHPKKATP